MGVYDRNSGKGRLGRPNYWISYVVEGKQYRETADTSDRRAAEALLKLRKREIHDGLWTPPAQRPKTQRPTVAAYFEQWRHARVASGVKTAGDECARLRTYVLPFMGDMRLAAVKRADVVALIEYVQMQTSERTGDLLAPRSVHRVYEATRAMFRAAVKAELIELSPCSLSTEPGELPPKKDKDPSWRAKAVFSRVELESMINDERIPVDRRVLYATAFLTGSRYGEVAGLQWLDYDPEAEPLGLLLVSKQYDGAPLKGRGSCTREVPVHPELTRLLAQWRAHGWKSVYGRHPKPEDLIVPRKVDFRPRQQAVTWRQWSKDLETVGLRHRRIHDTRRTLVSLARAAGARDDMLKWITHGVSAGKIMDVYTAPPWNVLCDQITCLKVRLRSLECADSDEPSGAGVVADEAFH